MPKVIDLPTETSMDNGDYLLMEKSTGGTKKITRENAVNLNAILQYRRIHLRAYPLDQSMGEFFCADRLAAMGVS